MSDVTTPLSDLQWREIDARVKRIDEDRWLSSRYAKTNERKGLVALYAFVYELARIQNVVSEDTLGAIRFQWWRDALSELACGKAPREHDVVKAVAERSEAGDFKLSGLNKVLDLYEAAFMEKDRTQEPEGWVAGIAARILANSHGWGEAIREVAPFFAEARRFDSEAYGPIVFRAPADIRPAIAHFRLRRHYVKGEAPGPMKKRLTVLRAIQTGIV